MKRWTIVLARVPRPLGKEVKDQSGIALFMVIAAMTVLSMVVSEFTYVAQVNSRMAIDSVDSIKAHYMAKTGLKISILRLKAYQTLKNFSKKQAGGSGAGGEAGSGMQLPAEILEQIWGFPFVFPIPKTLPGITPIMRDEIQKFENESAIPGTFSATIESDSGRINLNSLVEDYAAPAPSPSPSRRAGGPSNPDDDEDFAPPPPRNPGPNPSPSPSAGAYDVVKAREAMRKTIGAMLDQKVKADPDFAAEELDGNAQTWLDEFLDNLLAWMDYTHQPQNRSGKQEVPYKRAPLYHISELNMIHPMTDAIYNLFGENFTVGMGQTINVNIMQEPLLRTLFPSALDEEVTEFFKFRDSEEDDNRFKSDDDFWKYIGDHIGEYRGAKTETDKYRQELRSRGVRFVTDEETFKIRVVAEVNSASRIIEAWVTLTDPKPKKRTATQNPGQPPADPETTDGTSSTQSEPSVRITFMRES